MAARKPTRRRSATTAKTPNSSGAAPLSGADIIIQVLADEGVDTVFGYSGGAILPTYDAIFRHNKVEPGRPMKLIVPANEQGAGFMAAGYARASGKVGVCLVTSGPGATNAVTPIRDCMSDSIPVVLICGQVATAAIGTDAFQEAPIFNIMSSAAKQVYLVTKADELEATVRTAFEVARTGRPGPVVIDVPKDIQNKMGQYQGRGVLPLAAYRQRVKHMQTHTVSDAAAKKLLGAIEKSERPLIYAGGGVINAGASAELVELAEKLQIPVVTTLMGIGGISTQHKLSLHMLGMHGAAYANYAVEDCDLLLSVGARFDDRVAGKPAEFAPNARFIAHFDIDESEINKVKKADWHHVADAKVALRSVLDYQKKNKIVRKSFKPWLAHIDQLRRDHPMGFSRSSKLIQPQHVLQELSALTGGKAIVATGVGQHQMWAAQFFDFVGPRLWLTSGSMGTMGFGLPAAIGAQFACPDAIVIDVDGDGSIRMNLGELETVTTYGLPVKVLLLNNLGDGMVRQWQKLFYDDRFSGSDKSLHKKNFILAAQADGFEFARRVSKKADLSKSLRDFVAFKGPAFLEVMIDPDAGVYPMVAPGQSYRGMITGPDIPARTVTASASPKQSAADQF